jgi:hypothetical protein
MGWIDGLTEELKENYLASYTLPWTESEDKGGTETKEGSRLGELQISYLQHHSK